MSKELRTITSLEAWDICQKDPRALLVDVRSSMEYLFVGHPQGALHVPWIDEPDWVVNENFATEIRKLALGGLKESSTDDVPIILICRSGNRSDEAGKVVIEAGIRNVFHIVAGFVGKLDVGRHRSTIGGGPVHG